MLALDGKADVLLPFGLRDGRGRTLRAALLSPLNGMGELSASDGNPLRAALRLLAASLLRIGPYQREAIDLALVGGLLPIDRDYLLVQLSRLSFGDVRFQTVDCPDEGCGRRLDVRFDLSSVEAPAIDEPGGVLALPDGRQARYRWPTAGDQAALRDLGDEVLVSSFLGRCLRPDRDAPDALGEDEIDALPDEVRAAMVEQIVGSMPELDLAIDLSCNECERPFRFVYQPVEAIIDELRAAHPTLLREVHYLAFYYHWSEEAILGLSRARRRTYLALLDEELSGRAPRGVR